MAKNKVYIDVVVDDKGTTKRVAVNAEKLGVELDKTGKSARTADRNLKGAAQASANGTKNFSKMAQGISGGLVPAYATLAAQVFAVSAAFQFLKSASEVKNLIAGQEALGAATGVAYKSITNSIREATDGQLSYTEAARAAAIGTAAGLNPSQLDKLGNAAKNASFALGRDLTDSFNRLVRGVTKAEPELLDELGITLRLADATEEYARILQKPVKELTQLERTQAVANDVLEQAERKFGAIEKIMDPAAASLNKFLVSFESLINSIKTGTIGALTPIFDFLSQRTLSLTAALGLFALPIIRSILPSFDDWKDKASETFDLQKEKIKDLDKEYDGIRKTLKNLDADRDQALRNQQEDAAKVTDQLGLKRGTESGRGAADFLTGGATSRTAQVNADRVLKNAEKQIQEHGAVISGKLKGANAKQVADLRASYAQRVQILKGYEKQHASTWKKGVLDVKLYAISVKKSLAGLSGGIAAVSGRVAGMVSGLFSLAGWVGIGLLLVDVFKQMYEALFPMDPALQALNSRAEEMSQELQTLNSELAKTAQVKATPGLLNLGEKVVAVGNSFQSADLKNRFEELASLKGADTFDQVQSDLQGTINYLSQISPEFAEAAKNVTDFTDSAQTEPLLRLAQSAMNAGVATSGLRQNLIDVETEMLNLGKVGGKALDPTITLMQALERENQSRALSLESMTKEFKTAQQQARAANALRKQAKDRVDQLNAALERTPPGTFSEGGARRRIKAELALAKANLERAESEIEAGEAAKKKMLADLEAFGLNATRLAATKKLAADIKLINNEVMSNEKKIAREKTLGRNLDEQLVNFGLDRLASTNKVLTAEEALTRAIGSRRMLTSDADAKVKEAADNAVRNAEQARDIATAQNNLEQIKISLMEEQARLANVIRLVQEKALRDQTRLATEQRKASRTAAFSSNFLQAGAANREVSLGGARQKVGVASAQLSEAQATLTSALTPVEGTDLNIDAISAAQAQVAAKREAVLLARQELEILEKTVQVRLASLDRQLEENRQRLENFSFSPIERAVQEEILQYKKQGIPISEQEIQLLREKHKVLHMQKTIQEGLLNISDTMISSMERGIQGLITGTMTAKQAFLSMASAVLEAIAQMIAKMLVAQIISSALFSSFSFGAPAPTPAPSGGGFGLGTFRYGGVVKPAYASEGGVFSGRDGGYPAILHGTEAVVPLPNNRSIPVDLQGNAGQQNNVTVNVSIDNNGQATTDTQAQNNDAARMGKMISIAVQQELLNQKRQGGILNPYGVA